MTKALIIGPGYVGRSIIDLLLAEGKYEVTALVRSEAGAEDLRKDGVNAVLGDLEESNKIQSLAQSHHVIFHTATADHIGSAQAILDGIKHRASEGKQTIYLHQSGASVLSDGSTGDISSGHVYSDLAPADIDKLSDDAPHRNVDLAILTARRQLGATAKIFILMPPIIYGVNPKHPRQSIQIPKLTEFALQHHQTGVIGAGKGLWGTVHVLDLARAYLTILHSITSAPADSHVSNPYFFVSAAEVSWGAISKTIAKTLYASGIIPTEEVRAVPESKWGDLYGEFTPHALSCNARCRADRLGAMGWKPRERGVLEAFVEEDLPLFLKLRGE